MFVRCNCVVPRILRSRLLSCYPRGVPIATEIVRATRLRHSLLVRLTHWLTFLAFIALLVTGIEILISHPRFYWGEVGNVNTHPLFTFHIPSSRNLVPTGYGYVLPDQNGWSRYLHFQSAWVLVLTALVYGVVGVFNGHFRRNLLPALSELSPKRLAGTIGKHLRFSRANLADSGSYNLVQRVTYVLVIFRSEEHTSELQSRRD